MNKCFPKTSHLTQSLSDSQCGTFRKKRVQVKGGTAILPDQQSRSHAQQTADLSFQYANIETSSVPILGSKANAQYTIRHVRRGCGWVHPHHYQLLGYHYQLHFPCHCCPWNQTGAARRWQKRSPTVTCCTGCECRGCRTDPGTHSQPHRGGGDWENVFKKGQQAKKNVWETALQTPRSRKAWEARSSGSRASLQPMGRSRWNTCIPTAPGKQHTTRDTCPTAGAGCWSRKTSPGTSYGQWFCSCPCFAPFYSILISNKSTSTSKSFLLLTIIGKWSTALVSANEVLHCISTLPPVLLSSTGSSWGLAAGGAPTPLQPIWSPPWGSGNLRYRQNVGIKQNLDRTLPENEIIVRNLLLLQSWRNGGQSSYLLA